MSWLKAAAPSNMPRMVVTELVSQVPILALKPETSYDRKLMSKTPDVQEVASAVESDSVTSLRSSSRPRFVYVMPLTTPTSPIAATGQRTVTPFRST